MWVRQKLSSRVRGIFYVIIIDEQLGESKIHQLMTDECRGEHFARLVFGNKGKIANPIAQLFSHESSLRCAERCLPKVSLTLQGR